MDDLSWSLEERAWLGTIAEREARGDTALTIEYGDRFVAAQDALARPQEADRTYADWAAIGAAIEVAEDVPRALEERGIRLAEWMRLDRRVQRAARADEALAEELDRLRTEARGTASTKGDGEAGGEA